MITLNGKSSTLSFRTRNQAGRLLDVLGALPRNCGDITVDGFGHGEVGGFTVTFSNDPHGTRAKLLQRELRLSSLNSGPLTASSSIGLLSPAQLLLTVTGPDFDLDMPTWIAEVLLAWGVNVIGAFVTSVDNPELGIQSKTELVLPALPDRAGFERDLRSLPHMSSKYVNLRSLSELVNPPPFVNTLVEPVLSEEQVKQTYRYTLPAGRGSGNRLCALAAELKLDLLTIVGMDFQDQTASLIFTAAGSLQAHEALTQRLTSVTPESPTLLSSSSEPSNALRLAYPDRLGLATHWLEAVGDAQMLRDLLNCLSVQNRLNLPILSCRKRCLSVGGLSYYLVQCGVDVPSTLAGQQLQNRLEVLREKTRLRLTPYLNLQPIEYVGQPRLLAQVQPPGNPLRLAA